VPCGSSMCPEPVEGHPLALRLSTHISRFDELNSHRFRFDKLSAHSFGKNRRYSIWVVGGKPDYSKIAAKPDVIRLVHSPGVHLVTPMQ
jgi:hypothetical protein